MRSLLIFLLPLILIGCGQSTQKTYFNEYYGFSVTYPAKYKISEYKWDNIQQSAQLKHDNNYISIRASGAGTMYEQMSFDEYARIAASVEIQNYEALKSIEPFSANSGIKGYKTTWWMIETIPPDEWVEGMEPERHVSGPIYYFPPKELRFSGNQPVKTIMLSAYSAATTSTVDLDLAGIAKSFSYR